MQFEEFQTEVKRLSENFGARNFSEVKVTLLWNRFKNESIENFKNAVDSMILGQSKPPLIDDFGRAVAKSREKRWSHQKEKFANEERKPLDIHFAPTDQVIDVMGVIKKRLAGEVPDGAWDEFMLKVKKTYSPDHVWDQDKGVMVPNAEAPPEWRWLAYGRVRTPAK